MVSVGDLEQTATQNWAPHWLVCRITQLALKKAAGNLTYSTVPWSIAATFNEFAQFAEEICGTLKLRILEFPYVSICFHMFPCRKWVKWSESSIFGAQRWDHCSRNTLHLRRRVSSPTMHRVCRSQKTWRSDTATPFARGSEYIGTKTWH